MGDVLDSDVTIGRHRQGGVAVGDDCDSGGRLENTRLVQKEPPWAAAVVERTKGGVQAAETDKKQCG